MLTYWPRSVAIGHFILILIRGHLEHLFFFLVEHKLAFDIIREMLSQHCSNALSFRMVEEMAFSTSFDKVERELDEAEEMRQILLMENSFPSHDFIDMTEVLTRLHIEGSAIELESLLDLRVSLQTLSDVLDFFQREESAVYPHLQGLAGRVEWDTSVLKYLRHIVDDNGELFDDASDDLLLIRRAMSRKQAEVDAQIGRSLARAKREGWAPENGEVTIRNGRPVIPMLDTHRRKMKGIIHDESATRQTAFVEPSEVVELNNDLRQLQFDEHHEIVRILHQLSDRLRPGLPALLDAYWFLARIDFIRAKARLALQIHAVRPVVRPQHHIDWIDAFHPLLSNEGRKVVPFSLRLSDDEGKILIVSGPNAGGKSVLLKAVGLIQYMLQCGLLVPCRETSEFGLFDEIFIDIGDQQSMDDDLSTYSSHLLNMKRLLERAGEGTLFLLDELGGGTEPRSGCAIAEALLEELARRESWGVVTTHFADLKLMADHCRQIVNGAMLFDTQHLRPLYQLSVGHPGSSFAFEIASNIGFPQTILDAATEKVGSQMLNFEQQLQQIEVDKKAIEKQREELAVADEFLAEVTSKYQRLSDRLEQQRHQILSEARAEARQILADANRTVEQTISDIRKVQAEKEQTQEARRRLKAEEERLVSAQQRHDDQVRTRQQQPIQTQEEVRPHHADWTDAPIAVGTIVAVEGQDSYGEVVELKGRRAVVETGSLRMTIPVERLHATSKKTIPTERQSQRNSRFQSIFDDINEKRKHFNPTLDLRGQRAEEALDNLQHFLDEAALLSEKQLRILHGKGYGILKQLVREQLQSNPDVQSFRSEMIELGGDGITVVQLR